MARFEYSDADKADFLELAVEIGIGRAKRTLGFPTAWSTANRWVKAAGIEVPIDEIKAQAKAHHDWYQTEELLLIAQHGFARVAEALENDVLTPDEHKKLSEAYQKYANTWLLLQGKANNISESRKSDTADLALVDLLNEEKARNALIETNGANETEKEDSQTN